MILTILVRYLSSLKLSHFSSHTRDTTEFRETFTCGRLWNPENSSRNPEPHFTADGENWILVRELESLLRHFKNNSLLIKEWYKTKGKQTYYHCKRFLSCMNDICFKS